MYRHRIGFAMGLALFAAGFAKAQVVSGIMTVTGAEMH